MKMRSLLFHPHRTHKRARANARETVTRSNESDTVFNMQIKEHREWPWQMNKKKWMENGSGSSG